MPNKEFLEEYSLYRKFKNNTIPNRLDYLQPVAINMHCQICESNQTFTMQNKYTENVVYVNHQTDGMSVRLVYLCTHCENFNRYFFVFFNVKENDKWMMKIGQFPAWEITGNIQIEKLLGDHKDYYKKGLICESQGYGIGAFGYYRRIVEEIIDELLEEISGLLQSDELTTYQAALEKTKSTIVTSEKIDLVKDLLPLILRPEGMNPLSALHSTLSEGLHAESDAECLEIAKSCREILIFLVHQISLSKNTAKAFTTHMKTLLDKKSKSKS